MNKKGKMFVISGPSGSGKTTLYKKLLKTFNQQLERTISYTTRSKRLDESHGKDYFFVSPKMFQYKIRAKHFLEYEKVFDNYYGTAKKNIFDILRAGKHCLLCIDVKGARTVKNKFPSAILIFIKTPSVEVLKERLQARGTDSPKVIALRLNEAKREMAEMKFYDYVVENGVLSEAYLNLKKIFHEELRN